MTYEQSVINAKNKAVEFGLYSTEYSEAVKEMNRIWLTTPKTKTARFINSILKRQWHRKQKNS